MNLDIIITKDISSVAKLFDNNRLCVPISISREEGLFVAHCPSLDIAAYGDSVSEAENHFVEFTKIICRTYKVRSELEAELELLGWQKQGSAWRSPNF